MQQRIDVAESQSLPADGRAPAVVADIVAVPGGPPPKVKNRATTATLATGKKKRATTSVSLDVGRPPGQTTVKREPVAHKSSKNDQEHVKARYATSNGALPRKHVVQVSHVVTDQNATAAKQTLPRPVCLCDNMTVITNRATEVPAAATDVQTVSVDNLATLKNAKWKLPYHQPMFDEPATQVRIGSRNHENASAVLQSATVFGSSTTLSNSSKNNTKSESTPDKLSQVATGTHVSTLAKTGDASNELVVPSSEMMISSLQAQTTVKNDTWQAPVPATTTQASSHVVVNGHDIIVDLESRCSIRGTTKCSVAEFMAPTCSNSMQFSTAVMREQHQRSTTTRLESSDVDMQSFTDVASDTNMLAVNKLFLKQQSAVFFNTESATHVQSPHDRSFRVRKDVAPTDNKFFIEPVCSCAPATHVRSYYTGPVHRMQQLIAVAA